MPRIRRTITIKRETTPEQALCRQLDALQDAADQERDRRLGSGWFESVRDLYNVNPATYSAPTFRPRIIVPKLQTLLLNEATDLSDALPRVFIMSKDKRDKDREKAYQENWRQSCYNNRIMEAELWALFGGTGFLQVGFDPHARRGKGEVWLESRDPDTVHPDPSTKDWNRWSYVQFTDNMYIDEVRRLWPETAVRVVPRRGTNPPLAGTVADTSVQFTPGPMSVGPGIAQRFVSSDSIVQVRYTFIRDYSVEEIDKEDRDRMREVLDPLLSTPKFRPLYPDGRWIVDCEGVILADGPNPIPLGMFPIIPFRSMPSLGWFWGIPPTRYTLTLQNIAERMMTQTFENAVRLNNVIWFIDDNCGINANSFCGLPAEIQTINANSRVPEMRAPVAFPQHMTQYPEGLLALQDQLQGFSPARKGQSGAGNTSADLYSSSIYQSQFLTRLRNRLMAESIQATAELTFYMMANYYKDGNAFPGFQGGEVKMHQWKDMSSTIDDYSVYLDPGSLRTVSMAALRQLYGELLKTGKIPLKFALEAMEIPVADEIAEAQTREMELAALSRLKKPR